MAGKYNGWANYETWNVALWLSNDQGSDEYWREQAQKAYDGAGGDEEEAKSKLADMLENDIKENAPECYGMYSDILTTALGRVDWDEIAASYLEDVEKKSADEEDESEEERN